MTRHRNSNPCNRGRVIMATSAVQQIAHAIDPALWVRQQLQLTPMRWQDSFLRAPRGASILALTARQVGKTTAAAWAIAHMMLFKPGSLSVIACPAQRQSAEAVRRVHVILVKLRAKIKTTSMRSNSTAVPGCWRCRAATIRSGD
jgi:hypothetical protein